MSRRLIALLGGSFDPVHNAHLALADCFAKLLQPDELRVIPAGNPWQKQGLQATAEQRVAMLELAFCRFAVPTVIDRQEIRRNTPTYTIDTLRALRAELGPQTSLAFLMGADQLQRLHTWKEWRSLFDYAHLCVATRPGFAVEPAPEAAAEIAHRTATPQQLREASHGLVCIASDLALDVSATEIRTALQNGEAPAAALPPAVLDYIRQHHLYQT